MELLYIMLIIILGIAATSFYAGMNLIRKKRLLCLGILLIISGIILFIVSITHYFILIKQTMA